MNGFVKKLSSYRSSTIAILAFACVSAQAFNMTPGQIAQHQARRLLTSKQPFKQSGSVVTGGKTFSTELKWYGPASYDLTISNLPTSFTGLAGNEGRWVLERRPGNRCAIQIGNRHAQCSAPLFWAMIELSAQPEAVAGSLVRAGIYAPKDATAVETNSSSVIEPEKRRAKPAIGQNGDTPKAVVRITAPNADANNAENTPYIDFAQNFLVPLSAQFAYQGATHKIKAFAELGIDKEQPRNAHVMATSLTVIKDNETLARFHRKELMIERGLQESKFQDGVISLASLQESLSADANKLLTAILITH